MFTIEKFYCASLEDGTLILGWFSILYSIITAILSLFQVNFGGLFWYTFLGVGTGILLIYAVKKTARVFLLPWLGVNAFQIVILTPIALFLLIWNHISEPGVFIGALIYLILITAVIAYGWIGVFSLYVVYKNEEEYRASASPRGQV